MRKSRNRWALGPRLAVTVCLILAPALAVQSPARAGSEVQGGPGDLRLSVDNASTREVLQILANSFGVTFSLPASAGRNLSGTYSGTLRQVLARVLDGTDYILKVSEDAVEVVILGASGAPAIASSRPPIVAQNNVIPAAFTSKAPPPPLASYLAGNGPGRTP